MELCKNCNQEFEPKCHIESVERFGEPKQEVEVCAKICPDCDRDINGEEY